MTPFDQSIHFVPNIHEKSFIIENVVYKKCALLKYQLPWMSIIYQTTRKLEGVLWNENGVKTFFRFHACSALHVGENGFKRFGFTIEVIFIPLCVEELWDAFKAEDGTFFWRQSLFVRLETFTLNVQTHTFTYKYIHKFQ